MNIIEAREKMKVQQIERLIDLFDKGVVDNRVFSAVMRGGVKDCTPFLPYLEDGCVMVQISAIKIIGKFHSDLSVLNDLLQHTDNNEVVENIVRILIEKEEYINAISIMIDEDSELVNLFVHKLKCMGKIEYLTPLLFSSNAEGKNMVPYFFSSETIILLSFRILT